MLAASDPNTIVPQICGSAAGCVSGGVGTERNTADLGTQYVPVGALPNPFLGAVTGSNWLGSSRFSTYNAINVAFTRRFSSGLQSKANYAWAKSEDIVTGYAVDGGAGAPQSFWLNRQTGFGVSGINLKDQFVLSGEGEIRTAPTGTLLFPGRSLKALRTNGSIQTPLAWNLPALSAMLGRMSWLDRGSAISIYLCLRSHQSARESGWSSELKPSTY
jgi:hypothetical protein